MSDDSKDTHVNPELMEDLLGDQAAIRARLDQLEAAIRTNGVAVMLTAVGVVLVAASVYMLIRTLETGDGGL